MTKIILFGALLLLAPWVYSLSISNTTASNQSITAANNDVNDNSTIEDQLYNSVCTASDRVKTNCSTTELVNGCLCYNNGSCFNATTNRCKDCLNQDVFSSLEGTPCPQTNPFLCDAQNNATCNANLTSDCICNTDGFCRQNETNRCNECQKSDSLAVFDNRACPAQYLQNKNFTYFIPDVCDFRFLRSLFCYFKLTPGCLCYQNGTCEYRTDGEKCSWCKNSDVVSFNENEYCPSLSGKLIVCGDATNTTDCDNNNLSTGCICYTNATCQEKLVNHCTGCTTEGALDVIENGSCPEYNNSVPLN